MSCSINTLLSQSLLCFKVIITKCVLTQSQSRNEDHLNDLAVDGTLNTTNQPTNLNVQFPYTKEADLKNPVT